MISVIYVGKMLNFIVQTASEIAIFIAPHLKPESEISISIMSSLKLDHFL